MNENYWFNYAMDDEEWDETVKNYVYYQCKNISRNIENHDDLKTSALFYPVKDLYIISIAKNFHHALIDSLTTDEKKGTGYVFCNLQPNLVNYRGYALIKKFNAAYKKNDQKEMQKAVNEFKKIFF